METRTKKQLKIGVRDEAHNIIHDFARDTRRKIVDVADMAAEALLIVHGNKQAKNTGRKAAAAS